MVSLDTSYSDEIYDIFKVFGHPLDLLWIRDVSDRICDSINIMLQFALGKYEIVFIYDYWNIEDYQDVI